ncbi:unnamed protein product [Pedinophyceae sp. YPF-701]|nr:unnamed protein product [Pedinophyceae sp. YPF-701]
MACCRRVGDRRPAIMAPQRISIGTGTLARQANVSESRAALLRTVGTAAGCKVISVQRLRGQPTRPPPRRIQCPTDANSSINQGECRQTTRSGAELDFCLAW